MVSLIVPYSCRFFRMCSAYADCGLLFFMYRVCSRNLSVRLLLVCPIYFFGMSCKLFCKRHFVPCCGWSGGFCVLFFGLCVGALECYFGVCMFEKIGNFPDFGAMVCECGPFFVFVVFCCVYLFLVF
jgi:hypothetical protein